MAQPAKFGPVAVVNPRFCVPHPVDLAISQRVWQIVGRGDYVVKDINGNLMFKVERSPFNFHGSTVLIDAAGMPMATLRRKMFSERSRWQVFRGLSTEDNDLIFSARRSSRFQMKTKLHVFLANNVSEDVCDYMVEGSWFDRSCKVYVGDSSTIIAQTHQNSSIGSKFTGKNKFMMTVYPNIDYAFIVSLIVILNEIKSQSSSSSSSISTSTHTHSSTMTMSTM